MLSEIYKSMLHGKGNITYTNIDFNQICSSNSYEDLNPHIYKFGPVIKSHRFYVYNLEK